MRNYLLLVPLLFSASLGCTKPGKETTPPAPAVISLEGADLEKGKAHYLSYCASCHGAEGKGDGARAANFDVPPTDFTDPSVLQALSDADLVAWIRDGGKGMGRSILMPDFGRVLDEEGIRDVAAYVRTLAGN